eukprot:TRINITY_DN20399_c0_g1_i3.p1 TRINITY_DN20399_c0_g1~~TRINITY_DN20399_c0_g1_i3.p1  ORF type:complete len:1235 (+),score=303.28 TRINITY_DN20399_c0_g1_i3:275-3706(+)
MVGDNTSDGYSRRTPSMKDFRSDSGITSPFTPRSGSGTPSLPDDGEFPCTQCDKRFGNRRNLMSHMRRHTGDYKLFCEDCGKGFFTQSKLDSHKRKHTGEKPFRCLYKPCLKRFRYKGDLSKHIKRYHPGHVQELTPIPLQEDELAALENAQNQAKQKALQQQQSATAAASLADTSTLRTVLTTGLRPTTMIMTRMQPPVSSSTSNNATTSSSPSTTFIRKTIPSLPPSLTTPASPAKMSALGGSNNPVLVPDNDPTSLDDNLLDMFPTPYETDDPLLITSGLGGPSNGGGGGGSNGGTNPGSSIDTALVLPNTVFSSKPSQDQAGFQQLMSSGKSGTPTGKRVLLQVVNGGETTTIQAPKYPLPVQQILQMSPSSGSGSTSSTTLRNLLTSTNTSDSKIIRVPVNSSAITMNGIQPQSLNGTANVISNSQSQTTTTTSAGTAFSISAPSSAISITPNTSSSNGIERILLTGSQLNPSPFISGGQRPVVTAAKGGNIVLNTTGPLPPPPPLVANNSAQNSTPKHTFKIQTSGGPHQQIGSTVLTSAQLSNMILGSNGQVGGVILTSNSQPSNVILTGVLPSPSNQLGGVVTPRNIVLTAAAPPAGNSAKVGGGVNSSCSSNTSMGHATITTVPGGSVPHTNSITPMQTFTIKHEPPNQQPLPQNLKQPQQQQPTPTLQQQPPLLQSVLGIKNPVPLETVMNSSYADNKHNLLPDFASSPLSATEPFLSSDIDFSTSSVEADSKDNIFSNDALSLEDLLSHNRTPPSILKSESSKSDRDSDLTSPGSVRSAVSELEAVVPRKLEDGEKMMCTYPNCSKTFDKSNLLKRHLKVHTGEWRYVCDVCKKNFESNSKLEDHYRRHTGERPFQCHVCGSKFRYKGDRTKHLKNLHGVIKKQEQQNNSSGIGLMSSTIATSKASASPISASAGSNSINSHNSAVVSNIVVNQPQQQPAASLMVSATTNNSHMTTNNIVDGIGTSGADGGTGNITNSVMNGGRVVTTIFGNGLLSARSVSNGTTAAVANLVNNDSNSGSNISISSQQQQPATHQQLLHHSSSVVSTGTEDRLISSLSSESAASLMDLDPLDVGGHGHVGGTSPQRLLLNGIGGVGGCSSTTNTLLPLGQETVSMSLDDVLQYAQPVPDFSF